MSRDFKCMSIKILTFCLPLVILCVSLELLLRKIPNVYSYKANFISEHAGQISTLILGSSHTYYGVNPSYIKGNAFSLANISQSLDYDDWLLAKYSSTMTGLRNVIIPISYFSLYTNLDNGIEDWRKKYYKIYYGKSEYISFYNNLEIESNLKTISRKLFRYYLLHEADNSYSSTGFGLNYKYINRKSDLNKEGEIAAKRHTFEYEQKMVDDNIKSIISMIKRCKANNIYVLLITPPSWHTYSDRLNKNQLELTVKSCRYIAKEYHVTYINLLNDKRFVVDDYYDADHLNDRGAAKLANILSSYLE